MTVHAVSLPPQERDAIWRFKFTNKEVRRVSILPCTFWPKLVEVRHAVLMLCSTLKPFSCMQGNKYNKIGMQFNLHVPENLDRAGRAKAQRQAAEHMFASDCVYAIINITSCHWVAVCADLENQQLLLWDSLKRFTSLVRDCFYWLAVYCHQHC
jgi:hypothetical protein